jgi:hypothetical protein
LSRGPQEMRYSQSEFGNANYENRAAPSRTGACCTTFRLSLCLGLLLWLLVPVACRRASSPPGADGEIRALLANQVERWNAGDLVGFMTGYERSEQLRFHSGGDIQLGWQNVLDRYRRRFGNDRAGMGTLAFSELQIEPLGPESALAYGRWRVKGAGSAGGGELSGLFTLVLRKTSEGWRIRYDHTSSQQR